MTIRGVVGLLMWQSYRAAAINRYRVTRTKVDDPTQPEYEMQAIVVFSDAFKMTRTPLTFVALLKGARWEWPVLAHTFDKPSGRFSATLGTPVCIKEATSGMPNPRP
jgi:hypothetical protein